MQGFFASAKNGAIVKEDAKKVKHIWIMLDRKDVSFISQTKHSVETVSIDIRI